MSKRIAILAGLFFIICMPIAANAQFTRVPSQQLVSTLTTIRGLGDQSFQQVVWWAPNPSDPQITVPDWNNAEHQIMQLKKHDRDAVLKWLTGQGKNALYDRGATDRMIGSRSPSSFGPSRPRSSGLSQYRTLPLTSPTLNGAAPASGITVNGGFALIAKNATKAIVCLSFTNVGARTANEVDFSFPLVDGNGNALGTFTLDRKGTFSPNVAINGPADANTYVNNGPGPRAMFSNCVVSNQGTASLPLLQARFVTFKVVNVRYNDGTSWP